MTQFVPALAAALSAAQKCHWRMAVTLAFPKETIQPRLQPLQILSRLKGPRLKIWWGCVCSTNSFLLLATGDHCPWGEREMKAGIELLNPELWERDAIFLCSPFFSGGVVEWSGQARDLSRWETPPWEVSMVWLSLGEAPEPWAALKGGGQ